MCGMYVYTCVVLSTIWFWGWNSGCQAGQQTPLYKPTLQPTRDFVGLFRVGNREVRRGLTSVKSERNEKNWRRQENLMDPEMEIQTPQLSISDDMSSQLSLASRNQLGCA